MSKEIVVERVLVVRAFTVYQVRRLISVELPETVQNYQVRSVIVLGLLYAFDEDPNVRMKDIKKEIVKITQAINDYPPNTSCNIRSTRRQALRTSFVCIQGTHESSSRKEKHSTLKGEIYNLGYSKFVNLIE